MARPWMDPLAAGAGSRHAYMATQPSVVAVGTPGVSRAVFPDGLRGLAATWVLLYHLSTGKHINALKMQMPDWAVGAIFDAGHLGVAVFFVLSGFVMALTSSSTIFDGGVATRFVFRRLFRLTPPYYAALALGLATLAFKSAYLDSPRAGVNIGISDIVAHCFYLETAQGSPVINDVFWTLCIEVQFYIAFACLILLADRIGEKYSADRARFMVFAAVACVALAWPTQLVSTVLWTGGFVGLFYSFVAGVVVHLGLRFRGTALGFAWMYIGLLSLAGLYENSSFTAIAAITGAALLLAGTSSGMTRWLSARWLQFLGTISYSLYLFHNLIMGMVFRVVTHFGSDTPQRDLIGSGIALAASIAFAWLVYRLIEKPSINWSHAIRLRPQATHPVDQRAD
jgi:peptidoglycan/LPS O-acetylase OafA/YrhL